MSKFALMAGVFAIALTAGAAAAPLPDAAERFGAREAVTSPALSPDGLRLAYVAPAKGPANALLVADLATAR